MHTGEALPMRYGSDEVWLGAAKLAILSAEDSGHPKLLHVDIRVDIGRYRPVKPMVRQYIRDASLFRENSARKLGL